MLTAVILAAGAGSRLGALGRSRSKACVMIAGRPLINWVIAALHAGGAERFVVVRHPSDDELAAFLAAHHEDAIVVDQPARRGIADALRCAEPALATEPAYVGCACDSVFPPEDIAGLIDLGRRNPGAACVAVLEMGREATHARSAVRVEHDRVVEVVEKPAAGTVTSDLVAAPLYWLPRAIRPYLESAAAVGGERHVSTALNDFLRAGGVVLPAPVRRRVEITTAEDVDRAAAEIAELVSAPVRQ